MLIYIDADSCPVIQNIVNIAASHNIKTIIVKDYNHNININKDNVEIVTVSQENDAADLYIVKYIKKNDILITNDMGLASIALGKKAKILNFNGVEINDFNIDFLLLSRHENKINRKNNIYLSKIKKRTKNDDLSFEENLKTLLNTIRLED